MKTLLTSLLLSFSFQASAQTLSAATDGQRPASANPDTQVFVGPLRIADDLFYLGTDFVSCYLLVTDEGLILFDALYGEHTAKALAAIGELGFDAGAIRYVLVTHGHDDHAGGIAEVRAASNARAGMSAIDWELSGQEPDLVFADGDTLTLGGTTIRFLLTPGHTDGTLSMLFPVHDEGQEYTAFLLGGHNVTSDDPADLEAFAASVERLQRTLPDDVAVNLTSHPWASLILQRGELMKTRQSGAPNPFVNPQDFDAFLAERLASTRARLNP